MYTLLQWWVLLTLYFAYTGAVTNRPGQRRLALVCYLGATLTQFVAITLIPPLALAMVAVGLLGARERGERPWFRSRQVWLDAGGVIVVVLIAFLVKRAGQPKGIAPLEATGTGVATGIAQVVAIYGDLSTDLARGWQALAPFFTASEAILPTALALLATGWALAYLLRRHLTTRDSPTLFLALILAVTTLEMVFFVSPERRDDKYLFMLQPALFLLAADGLTRLASQIVQAWQTRQPESKSQITDHKYQITNIKYQFFALVGCLVLLAYAWPATSALLARTGSDYDTAFGYVRDHWQEGDAVLTGTPSAAALYLGRNDYYAVRGTEGYAYRILDRNGDGVERWLGSPWLETDEEILAAFNALPRVWLVLERWGLIKEYYSPLTMQRILAMTDFVREDTGIVVLSSRPSAQLIPVNPSSPLSVNFDDQLTLDGYHLTWETVGGLDEGDRVLGLVLYWQAQSVLPFDYTVFVHLRDAAGQNVAQADHQPLAPVYPPTLWPVGQTIRDRGVLTLPEEVPAGEYNLWVGVYRLDTLERLPVVDSEHADNAVLMGPVVVP